MLEQNDLRGAWCYRVWDGQLREAFDGPPLRAVEEDRAVQLWRQRQRWRLQFDPADIVVNDFMVVHSDVDGDIRPLAYGRHVGYNHKKATPEARVA